MFSVGGDKKVKMPETYSVLGIPRTDECNVFES